jgi:restriction system protein
MASPKFRDPRTYLAPLVRVLVERGASRPARIYDDVADLAAITPEQREAVTDRGAPVYRNRIQFARQGLVAAGLIIGSSDERWQRGVWELEDGTAELAAALDDNALDRELRDRVHRANQARALERKKSRRLAGLVTDEDDDGELVGDEEDDDAIADVEELVDELNQGVFGSMLDHLRSMDETQFEHLVGDVLKRALGAERVHVTPKSRDGGVDGILYFDSLQLQTAVYEAKRYAEDNTVGRGLVDAFATAARRRRATHSLFVTTSRFSREAQAAARDEGIRLVDGDAFVELMALHELGLQPQHKFVVYSVDPAWSIDDDDNDE